MLTDVAAGPPDLLRRAQVEHLRGQIAFDGQRGRDAARLLLGAAAFVQERLTKDEFDLRVGRALASRTYADLAALTADIPAGRTEPASAGARPETGQRAPRPRREDARPRRAWACCSPRRRRRWAGHPPSSVWSAWS